MTQNRIQRVCLLSLVAIVGCGPSASPTYSVTGQVLFGDVPVTEGSVTFEDSATGIAETFAITPEGAYEGMMPEGSYSVSVQPPMVDVPDAANSEGGQQFKRVSNIPNRYWSAYESGLDVIVSGDTTFDIKLTGRK